MFTLHAAAREDNRSLVNSLLLGGADVAEKDSDGNTPLHASTLAGNCECTGLLLAAHADPNAVNDRGYTPLHFATLTSPDESAVLIGLLLSAGADSEMRLRGDCRYEQVRNWTPLMLAASEGRAAAVDALINAKANINATDWVGMTALMLAACRTCETELKIKLLLEARADKYLLSNEGKSALDYAREHAQLIEESLSNAAFQITLGDIHEKTIAKLKRAGVDVDGFKFVKISEEITNVLKDWPLIIELLENDH